MEQPATWEMMLTGILVLVLLLWLRPGIKEMFRQSKEAEERDWKALLIPLIIVVLFVMFLIMMV